MTEDCADDDLTCCAPGGNAWFHDDLRNTINLCPGFWNPPADLPSGLSTLRFRAGVLVHEMLHMLYEHLRDAGHGRIRVACYEAFVLHVNWIPPSPSVMLWCVFTT